MIYENNRIHQTAKGKIPKYFAQNHCRAASTIPLCLNNFESSRIFPYFHPHFWKVLRMFVLPNPHTENEADVKYESFTLFPVSFSLYWRSRTLIIQEKSQRNYPYFFLFAVSVRVLSYKVLLWWWNPYENILVWSFITCTTQDFFEYV